MEHLDTGFAIMKRYWWEVWPHLLPGEHACIPAILSHFPMMEPSLPGIAAKAGRNRQTVIDDVEGMVKVGLLTVVKQLGKRNKYYFANLEDDAVRASIIATLKARKQAPYVPKKLVRLQRKLGQNATNSGSVQQTSSAVATGRHPTTGSTVTTGGSSDYATGTRSDPTTQRGQLEDKIEDNARYTPSGVCPSAPPAGNTFREGGMGTTATDPSLCSGDAGLSDPAHPSQYDPGLSAQGLGDHSQQDLGPAASAMATSGPMPPPVPAAGHREPQTPSQASTTPAAAPTASTVYFDSLRSKEKEQELLLSTQWFLASPDNMDLFLRFGDAAFGRTRQDCESHLRSSNTDWLIEKPTNEFHPFSNNWDAAKHAGYYWHGVCLWRAKKRIALTLPDWGRLGAEITRLVNNHSSWPAHLMVFHAINFFDIVRFSIGRIGQDLILDERTFGNHLVTQILSLMTGQDGQAWTQQQYEKMNAAA